ncbi:NAD(P)/FAD-dependent oxidoreductase [Mycoplasma phocoeninasale]|uniref:FAD-dependent oxidoreductase n=1 Tax=Mycoplasma phocoeninasale TaxID=2726117 RepID=A0A858TZG9_9MOLU|nr:FAD-dependent oxidoreductase [Mycoplasma phocoeninasale]MBN0970697.1 FAD-dependent oxidoreductase [Mycoplasma phocoeninasale]QJG66194.1 FAD-dependent oxidoreductase [Mycoplasma phocoeninasale]
MEKFDVIIIGAGPAGLTAALYLGRNNASVAFIEGKVPGGKMPEQSKIENYPGFDLVSGVELSNRMLTQARANHAKFIFGNVRSLNNISDCEKEVVLENGNKYLAKVIIIASGMKNVIPLDVANIEKFNGRGVSYCAICDGAIYSGKPCAIIGGGNSAFDEAPFLASVATEVHMFIRDGITAEKKLIDDVKKIKNIVIHENSKILELKGNDKVESIVANINGKVQEMDIKAVFPYVGFKPATAFVEYKEIMNKYGFIQVDKNMETKIKNIFAIGDVVEKDIRQITTATSDGTIAAKVIGSRINME